MSFLLPGWWLVTVAQGDPNETLDCAVRDLRRQFIVASRCWRGRG